MEILLKILASIAGVLFIAMTWMWPGEIIITPPTDTTSTTSK